MQRKVSVNSSNHLFRVGMRIAIIGSGNGGQAMAGHFSYLGHEVRLYARDVTKLNALGANGHISLTGVIECSANITLISDNLESVVKGAELIMIVTVANAHREIAIKISPLLEDEQIVVLNPGRTFGAIEFRNILKQHNKKKIYVAETQSLLYACRSEYNGIVRIIGIKDKLPMAALPSSDTNHVLKVLQAVYPSFISAKNVLETSLDNIGCIFHPSIVLFNAAKIERGERFYFYNDMTPAISTFIEALDKERLFIGEKLGVRLLSANEWISYSYKDIKGTTLCEKMKNNPAYYKILAPTTLNSRLLTEDIPTGILPLIEISKVLNVSTPLLNSVYNITSKLLNIDFRKDGRTLMNLGLNKLKFQELLNNI